MTWVNGSDDDTEYSTPEEARRAELAARVAAQAGRQPTNPWIVTLAAIVAVGLLVGVILIVIGTVSAKNFGFEGHGDTGIGEIVWGGSLAGLGLSALFPLFAAQAVIWHLRSRPTTN